MPDISYASKYLGKTIEIKIDRPLGTKHPKHKHYYSVNYGYIEGTKSGDGEPLDTYVLGVFKPLKIFKGRCIAVIHRLDDNDDKLVVVPDGINYTNSQVIALTEFQERWFKSKIIRRYKTNR